MASVLFRVDAGARVGLGHLQRCLSLASALRQLDVRCIFLAAGEPAVRDRVVGAGFGVHALNGVGPGDESDLSQTLDTAAEDGCEGVIVDSYSVDEWYLGRLREAGLLVVAIDDTSSVPFPCHLLVNGGAQAPALPYRSSTGDTRFLLGPEYALLREEFWSVPARSVADPVRNVLLMMGGADGRNLTPLVLRLLEPLAGGFGVTAVVGPFSKNHAEIDAVVAQCRRSVSLVRAPCSVLDLMLRADLAVSAGGQTLYELAAAGTPTLAIKVVENQAGNVSGLAQRGVVSPILFESKEQLRRELQEAVTRLLTASDERMQMSQAGRRLVDGRGAKRTAKILAEMLSASGSRRAVAESEQRSGRA